MEDRCIYRLFYNQYNCFVRAVNFISVYSLLNLISRAILAFIWVIIVGDKYYMEE